MSSRSLYPLIALTLLTTACGERVSPSALESNRYLKGVSQAQAESELDLSKEAAFFALKQIEETASSPLSLSLSRAIRARYTQLDQEKQLFCTYQLQNTPSHLPIVPGESFALSSTSVYDDYKLHIACKMPEVPKEGAPIYVFLGRQKDFPSDLKQEDAWFLFLPSRPVLNYELLAEGDLRHSLENFRSLYPSLAQSPIYLVAEGKASEPALQLANHYQQLFSGVAWSGEATGIGLKNLDRTPLIYFASEQASPAPFTGQQVIHRFQKRGNQQAFYTASLQEALDHLQGLSVDYAKPYAFRDYQHAAATPWAQVLHKVSEEEEAIFSYFLQGNELHIEGKNLSHLLLKPEFFPEEWVVNSVFFGGDRYLFINERQQILVGPSGKDLQDLSLKASSPGSLLNFFRNEPVVIVYQDTGMPPEPLRELYLGAKQLAKLDFTGLPEHSFKLPMIPLSSYTSEKYQGYRVIFWGEEKAFAAYAGADFLPLQIEDQNLYINGKHIASIFSPMDSWAYMITTTGPSKTPPTAAFIAKDAAGFHALRASVLKGTSLYQTADLTVMGKEQLNQNYQEIGSYTFGGFWDTSAESSFLFYNPFESQKPWERIIANYLLSQTKAKGIISLPFFYDYHTLPSTFTKATLEQVLQNRSFSLVSFRGWEGATLFFEILKLNSHIIHFGLDPYISVEPSQWPSNFSLSVVVDNHLLMELPELVRNQLIYTPLPFTLQEWLEVGVEQDIDYFRLQFQELAQHNSGENTHG